MIFLSCHHLLCEIRNRQMHEVGVLWDYNVGSGGKTKVASSIAAPLLFHRWEQNCLGQQLWWQLLMLLQSTLKFNRAEPQPRQLPVIHIFRAKHHCNGLILSALFRSWKKKESKFVATDTMTTQTTRTSSLCTIVSQNPIPFLWKKKKHPPPPPSCFWFSLSSPSCCDSWNILPVSCLLPGSQRRQIQSGLTNTNIMHSICHKAEQLTPVNGQCVFFTWNNCYCGSLHEWNIKCQLTKLPANVGGSQSRWWCAHKLG